MRKRPLSFFAVLLCLMAFVDFSAFKGLEELSSSLPSAFFNTYIQYGYWAFSLLLMAGIVWAVLNFKHHYAPAYERSVSYLTGIGVLTFIPKTIFSSFYGLEGLSEVINTVFFDPHTIVSEVFIFLSHNNIITYAGIFAAGVPFMYISHGILRGRFDFKVVNRKLPFKNLPESFNGLKVVQISDLHLGSFNHRHNTLNKAIEKINALDPDLILFTGDLVNNYAEETEGWKEVLSRLKARIGKYSILGNHDYGDYGRWISPEAKAKNLERIKAFHKEIGFDLLLNESSKIQLGKDTISLIGIENWGKPPFMQYGDLGKAMEMTDPYSFKILLSHDPSHWDAEVIKKTNIDLTLSGHTHGMQLGIGIGKKKWSPVKQMYPRWRGLYTENGQHLYVNTGLGYLGFPGRIGMPPEITAMELVRQTS